MRALLSEYHGVVKKNGIHWILENTGISQSQLPNLKEHVNPHTGKSTLCWNYLRGECFFGPKCHFASGHVLGNRLPDDFVEDALRGIKPGVDALVQSEKAKGGEKCPFGGNGSGYYGPGGDSNKQRR